MVILSGELIETLFEQVGPYISDIDHIKKWLGDRQGKELVNLLEEIEGIIESGLSPSQRTDFRILRNAIEKIN